MTGHNSLPEDATARNAMPMADGLLYYFPNALAEVSKVSKIGNDQHNPGEPLHWSRGKSTDHANKIMRHLVDAGGRDSKGVRHSAYMAWRALALLQEEIERDEGAPLPRNARFDEARTHGEEDAALRTYLHYWEVVERTADALRNSFPPNCDGLKARDIRAPHPMQAETLRQADEFGRDDNASGV